MRTLDELEYAGKRVVVRVDFNVPLDGGAITDDTRIEAALPTLRELREGGAAKLVLLAHLGRPKGVDPSLSLQPVAGRLGELLGLAIAVADTPEEAAAHDAEVVMVENVRFFEGETKDDAQLAARYAAAGDVFVNDAFGAAHRAPSWRHGIAERLPSAAGRLLQREVETLTGILESPERPLIAVVGGAKVTDKIGVLDRFAQLADQVVIGGAMVFPFLKAQGHAVGASLCEEDGIAPARELLETAAGKLVLPDDLVLGDRFDPSAERTELDGVDVPEGLMGLDIGPRSAARYAEVIRGGRTVFWNGPMGAFELAPFAAGTRTVAEAVVDVATSVVGGGDSVAAVNQFGLAERATHISTGGGASLELIEGRALPGVEVLS